MLLAMLALALAWRFGPLAEIASPSVLFAQAERLRQVPLPVLLVVVPLLYIALGLVLCPIVVLRAVTVLVFGPILGPAFAVLGALASAMVGHAIGVWLGKEGLERIAGPRVQKILDRLKISGTLPVAAMRMVPLGPFTLVNAVAGAAGVRRRHFFFGTLLGTLPGVLVMALFSAEIELLLH